MDTIENDNPNDTPNTEAVDLAEKVVNEDAVKKDQEEMQKVSEQVKKVLEENKMALQPSLNITQFGILPMVNLVRLPEPKEEKVEVEDKTDDK